MSVVLDCSVVMSWCFADEASEQAERLLSETLSRSEAIVPAIWRFELRNVLIVNERRGRIDRAGTTNFLADVRKLPIRINRQTEEVSTMALARDCNLSFYDATYLNLAVRRRLPLATLDRKLISAAQELGVELALDPGR